MMVTGSMQERDRVTMQDMVKGGYVHPHKAEPTPELIIAVHQNFIYETIIHRDTPALEAHKAAFPRMFEYLLAAAKYLYRDTHRRCFPLFV